MMTVLIIDQFMKQIAVGFYNMMPILKIPGIIEFTVLRNDGMAFGLLRGHRFLVIGIVAVVLIAVFYISKSMHNVPKRQQICIFMIIGGGVSNLLDRIFRGGVIDYINVKFFKFAAFNLADVCVCLGCFFLIFFMLLGNRKERKNKAD
jgi:signal peptidase II